MCMSNHFIIDKEALCDPLSQIFTAMLCHGIIPDSIRDCILVPIPKLGKDPDSYVFFSTTFVSLQVCKTQKIAIIASINLKPYIQS